MDALYAAIEACAVRPGICKTAGLKLVYTPLNGSGNVPVRHVLADIGITDVTVVPEQEYPDGNFPTCPYPNPEIREALALGLALAEQTGADLMLATDPDADRVGIAVRTAGGGYQLLMLSSKYEVATDEVNAQCNKVEQILKKYDEKGMLIGEAPCTRDLIKITDHDFMVVSAVSILAIFVIILLVLKSISLPVILVAVIELAIYINMALAYFTGTTLPFIASICIGTIQLGATVDYAILMTTRYKKERMAGCSKEEAVKIALSTSIHSIMSSALGFFAATIGVGLYSDVDLIGSLCLLMARGAIISMFVVIFIMPSMYMLLDKLICKTTLGLRNTVDV